MKRFHFCSFMFFMITCFFYATNVFCDEDVLTLQTMCHKSSDIVTAEVVSVRCFSPEENKKQILTSIKLRIETTLKGSNGKGNIIEIITYGGTVNGTTITVTGAPRFIEGEKILVFLKEWTSDIYGRNFNVFGRSQGKFNIIDSMVSRDFPAPLRKYKSSQILNTVDGTKMYLSSFKQEIENLIK